MVPGKNTVFHQKLTLNLGTRLLDLKEPKIMGILNLTPDSFFDGGKHNGLQSAVNRTRQMIGQGADIIDLGAYSSRPGAKQVTLEEEKARLLPVVEAIRKEFPEIPLSIDTFRAELARSAIREGANIINDISGGQLDPLMFETVADLQAPYILMHMRGTPQTMSTLNTYQDILPELILYFSERIHQLRELGVKDIVIDPGFGFAKDMTQNYQLLNQLEQLRTCGHPILVAASRKSMIYKALDIDAQQALNGTTVVNTIALMKGANILRVHDITEAREAVRIVNRLRSS